MTGSAAVGCPKHPPPFSECRWLGQKSEDRVTWKQEAQMDQMVPETVGKS